VEGLFCWEPPTTPPRYFPSQTIHLAIVDPGVGSSRSIVAIRTENQVFIAPDNGVLTLILRDTRLEQAVWVTNPQYMLEPVSRTFHGRDVFAPAAAHLASGIDFASLGSMADPRHLVRLPLERAGVSENEILAGSITHIDHFGNLVTDIDRHRLHHIYRRPVDHGCGNRGRRSGDPGRIRELQRCRPRPIPGRDGKPGDVGACRESGACCRKDRFKDGRSGLHPVGELMQNLWKLLTKMKFSVIRSSNFDEGGIPKGELPLPGTVRFAGGDAPNGGPSGQRHIRPMTLEPMRR